MSYLTWTYDEPGAEYLPFGWPGSLDAKKETRVFRMTDKDGVDLTPVGHHRKRKSPARGVVLHWPGNTVTPAVRTASMFMRSKTPLSTHFCVDHTGIFQTLALDRVAYHVGTANELTIGVDICQPQTNEAAAYSQKFEPWGPGGRNDALIAEADEAARIAAGSPPKGKRWKPERLRYGKLTYLPLDPRVINNVVALLLALEADGMEIALRPWLQWTQERKTIEQWLEAECSVVNHGDLPGTKIDALPWYKSIAYAFSEAK